MADRLDLVRIAPPRLLDLGCGIGEQLELLRSRYPDSLRVGLDLSQRMLRLAAVRQPWYRRVASGRLRVVCGDAVRLPFAAGAFGLVWSNFALNWALDPPAAFREVLRVLDVGGLFMFSMPGPDTLRELRQASASGGPSPRVHTFIDMHDLGDMLVAAGFADPVMDMEILTLTYPDVDTLVRELRDLSAGNMTAARMRGLTGKATWRRMNAAYAKLARDGRLPATVEVVYGHAWRPAPRKVADGREIVHFSPARRRD